MNEGLKRRERERERDERELKWRNRQKSPVVNEIGLAWSLTEHGLNQPGFTAKTETVERDQKKGVF